MSFYHKEGKANGGGNIRIVTGPDGTLDIISRAMLTGGNKYSKTTKEKEGEEKLKLLGDIVQSLDELIIIGYSFGDPHVNYRVLNAMVLNPLLKIWIVDPIHRRWPEFLQQFDYDFRLRRVISSAAVWMTYASEGKWNRNQIEALKTSQQIRRFCRIN